jgi:hypothetical protein
MNKTLVVSIVILGVTITVAQLLMSSYRFEQRKILYRECIAAHERMVEGKDRSTLLLRCDLP